ncbi:MAG: DNA polymerase III subunit delta [Gemmatimonadales bacterium]|jgi:DNA polymerase-3 subunit delta
MRALDFDALWKALRKGVLHPVYYLYGDEELLKDEAVRNLLEFGVEEATRDFNLDRRRAPELAADDFHALVHTPPMMAARRGVLITEVEFLLQKKPKAQALRTAVLAYAGQASPETLLVLVQSAGDKPDPALAKLAQEVVLDPLPPDRLAGWIRREAEKLQVALDEGAIGHLIATVGSDLPSLAAELAKLAGAVSGRVATADDVADLVGVRHGETLFDFVDAVTARRGVAAAEMAPRLLDAPGVTGVRLVAALSTALVGVALARALLDDGASRGAVEGRMFGAIQDARPFGLRNWRLEAERWTRDAAQWTLRELDAAIAELLRADRRLKHTTVAGAAEILQEALLAMAGQAAGAV